MKDQTSEMINEIIQNILSKQFASKSEQEALDLLGSDKFQKSYHAVFDKVTSKMAETDTSYFEKAMYEEVWTLRNRTNEFLARLEQMWGKGFIAFEAMYILATEIAKNYCEYVSALDTKKEKQCAFYALQHIHGRACQQYWEILCLMQNGFADGAYSRWRTMYELGIVAEFILLNGEAVAESFIKSANTDDRWYNWAKIANCFDSNAYKGKNIMLDDLRMNTKKDNEFINAWKKHYTFANKLVHASAQGTFARLGIWEGSGNTPIPVGRSNYGFFVVAEHSTIYLALISRLFLSVYPYGDGVRAMKHLDNWVDVVRKYFCEVEESSFIIKNES